MVFTQLEKTCEYFARLNFERTEKSTKRLKEKLTEYCRLAKEHVLTHLLMLSPIVYILYSESRTLSRSYTAHAWGSANHQNKR